MKRNPAMEAHAWWGRLSHKGLFLSPSVLAERYPDAPALPDTPRRGLREAVRATTEETTRYLVRKTHRSQVLEAVDALFGDVLTYPTSRYIKQIPADLKVALRIGGHTDNVAPDRIILAADNETPLLAVMADENKRIGFGKGGTSFARLLEYLRATDQKLGLITNGKQLRLVYAGLDFYTSVEWELERWFDGGEGDEELAGLCALLAKPSLTGYTFPDKKSGKDKQFPSLREAVEESRNRQAELSDVLGEAVRVAVESLAEQLSIADSHRSAEDSVLRPLFDQPGRTRELSEGEAMDALQQALVRIVMRCVVLLFAESRDNLLPNDDPIYNESYSIRTLYQQLLEIMQTTDGRTSLRNRRWAWARLTALFHLIHDGSRHPEFQSPSYGGLLFRPGRLASETGEAESDPVLRALAILEQHIEVHDDAVYDMLRRLVFSEMLVPVKGGRRTRVAAVVDYSQLDPEVIGLIYQGLLDYKLKRTGDDLVELRIGRTPFLEFDVLQNMEATSPRRFKDLLGELKKEKTTKSGDSDDQPDNDEPPPEPEEPGEDATGDDTDDDSDTQQPASDDDPLVRVHQWARDALITAGLIKPKKKLESDAQFDERVTKEVRKLIPRVYRKGDFVLLQMGNVRKGSGTFYTKRALAAPLVKRTLAPLLYQDGETGRQPRTPEEILALKVCDPACGSGSFLVYAAREITDALYKSLVAHRGFADPDEARRRTLPFGRLENGDGEKVRYLPLEQQEWEAGTPYEEMVRALLKRYAIEYCLYGVDLHPLAVELARISLWVESMDRRLPLGFLDHKIKVGNSLVGTELKRVLDYPLNAWERDGGDGPKGERTNRIDTLLKGEKSRRTRSGQGRIRQEMIKLLQQRITGQLELELEGKTLDPGRVLDDLRGTLAQVHRHAIQRPEEAEQAYHAGVDRRDYQRVKEAMDEWCAVWFWPMDETRGDFAPTPLTMYQGGEQRRRVLRDLVEQHRFFHWELEFPDVFLSGPEGDQPEAGKGFDAILGNPPWEVMKPNSHEFFSEYDPLYRTYDKQRALRRQQEIFSERPDAETRWLDYNARFKAMSNWVKNVAQPYAGTLGRGKELTTLTERWELSRKHRGNRTTPDTRFQYQGSADLNSYKMFLELGYTALNASGRLGMLVPSALYTDAGSQTLRKLFLEQATWEWLFSFENRLKIFDIHRSFKFLLLVVDRQQTGRPLRTAFMVHDPQAWEDAPRHVFDFDPTTVEIFSPVSRSIPEIRSPRDLEISRKIYDHSFRIGDQRPGWEIEYATEFHMTNDSHLFKPRPWWEQRGYRPDKFGRWVNEKGDVALPLYQGGMIHQLNPTYQGFASGGGTSNAWHPIDIEHSVIEPKYYMSSKHYQTKHIIKYGFRDVARNTDQRTFIGTPLPDMPCGNKVPRLKNEIMSQFTIVSFSGIASSLSFDFVTRIRFNGSTLNYFIVKELPIPNVLISDRILTNVLKYSMVASVFSPQWLLLNDMSTNLSEWKHNWAITEADRLRLRVEIDALVADLYGLDPADFDWIVGADPHNPDEMRPGYTDDPKGFWRVDKQLPFRERLTGLAARAFRALKEGRWDADRAASLSNDEFFEAIGIPELTNDAAAKAKGLPPILPGDSSEPAKDRATGDLFDTRTSSTSDTQTVSGYELLSERFPPNRDRAPRQRYALIYKRPGPHEWHPERFPEDDPRHGWTWDHCRRDAIELLGSQQALDDFLAAERAKLNASADLSGSATSESGASAMGTGPGASQDAFHTNTDSPDSRDPATNRKGEYDLFKKDDQEKLL